MINIPANYKLQRALAELLHKRGQLSLCAAQKELRPLDVPSHVEGAANAMIRRGWVVMRDDVLTLSPELAASMTEAAAEAEKAPKPEIVRPSTINRMAGELSAKYLSNPYGRRPGSERREITYQAMTSNIPGAARSYD